MWTKTNLETLEKLCKKFEKISSELTTLCYRWFVVLILWDEVLAARAEGYSSIRVFFSYLQNNTRCMLSYLIILGDFVVKLLIDILSSFNLPNVIVV